MTRRGVKGMNSANMVERVRRQLSMYFSQHQRKYIQFSNHCWIALDWALSSGVRALSRSVAKLCWTRYLYARVESGILAPVERDMKGSLWRGAFRTLVYC